MPPPARRLAVLTIDYDGAAPPPVVEPPTGSGIEIVRYRTRYPVFPRTPHDRLLTALMFVEMAERAAADGCDALYLDVFPDYGLAELRGAVAVPAIGSGEAAIAAAAAKGPFSIVTVWPRSMGFLYRERLANAPGGEACAAVHHVFAELELGRLGTDHSAVSRMERGDRAIVDYIADCCRRAIEEDGTSAVLLGCTCMAPIGDALQERCDFPIVEASRVGFEAAYAVMAPDAVRGELSLSARRGTVPLIVDAWLAHGEVPQLDIAGECEVCVIVADA